MCARFLQGILRRLLILLERLFFRGNLFFAGMDLRTCASELCLLFGELKMLSPRVEFHQNISSLHFPVQHQMGCYDSAAHCGLN